MPLPMVHLAVAVTMHDSEKNLPSQDFLLGSIAPDAIHMRPDSEFDDKRQVHLSDVFEIRYERIRTLYLKNQFEHPGDQGFAEGYVAHLLTDYLWQERVVQPFHERLSEKLPPTERRVLYYQEADQIDFLLYYKMPWRAEVWGMLSEAQPQDFGSLLTAEEIQKWRDRVLFWFEEIEREPEIEPSNLTYEDTLAFIDQTAVEINGLFEKWNQQLA